MPMVQLIEYHSLSRRELQKHAKAAGIRANAQSKEIIAKLEARDREKSEVSYML